MRSIILNLLLAYGCVCAPVSLVFAGLTFLRPIRTARTLTQRTLYILLVAFFPLLLPAILALIAVSLLIQPAFLLIASLVVPLVGVFLLLIDTTLPRIDDFSRQFSGRLPKRIFLFLMDLPTFPLKQIDKALDTLAAWSIKLLTRDSINKLIGRREADQMMRLWGRRDASVSFLLAQARDPGLDTGRRNAAIMQLGRIASEERSHNFTQESEILDPLPTPTGVRLRELACDRAVAQAVRLMAATTLVNQGFRGEARLAYFDLTNDPKIADPRVRIRIAQESKGLGQEFRSQAVDNLLEIMADEEQRMSVRCEAARSMIPFCDNEDDAARLDPILEQCSREENSRPLGRLQAARILAKLDQHHQNNPDGLSQRYRWKERAVAVVVDLAGIPYTRSSVKTSVQALQILCNLGEIDALIRLGRDETLSYPVRRAAASILEDLGQADEAVVIWMDLAMIMPINPAYEIVTPLQRIEAATAAGQGIYVDGQVVTDENNPYPAMAKEILQTVAQQTCVNEPLICLEAAAALRQLGWYEDAISFVMMLYKNHGDELEVSSPINEAMRWREL